MSSGTLLVGVWEEVECNQVRREDVLVDVALQQRSGEKEKKGRDE